MSRKQAIYDKLINGNIPVENRYFTFISRHKKLHGKFPVLSWGYALLLYINYGIFHFPDRKFGQFTLSAEQTAEILCKADIVSFDIFDTLIFRRITPKQLFENIGGTLGITDFADIRTDCESKARKEKKEPCLNDIYRIAVKEARLTDKKAEEAMKAECDAEFSACYANPFMLEVYNKVITSKKTVIITTDMYLTESVISKLLYDKGFRGFEKLFVSYEYGCGKADGKLYEVIKSEYGDKRIVHIGDNYMSDVLMAEKTGVEAVYYRK